MGDNQIITNPYVRLPGSKIWSISTQKVIFFINDSRKLAFSMDGKLINIKSYLDNEDIEFRRVRIDNNNITGRKNRIDILSDEDKVYSFSFNDENYQKINTILSNEMPIRSPNTLNVFINSKNNKGGKKQTKKYRKRKRKSLRKKSKKTKIKKYRKTIRKM
jgi:hypothetical protein